MTHVVASTRNNAIRDILEVNMIRLFKNPSSRAKKTSGNCDIKTPAMIGTDNHATMGKDLDKKVLNNEINNITHRNALNNRSGIACIAIF